MSNIIDSPDGKYSHVHYNEGVTHTNNIGELPGQSNHAWYNLKGVANILSLGLVQKQHLVTYNSQDGNEFDIHTPQGPKFKMIKAGILYQNMRYLLKNNLYAMVNNSRSSNPHVGEKKKQYTACDVKRCDFEI